MPLGLGGVALRATAAQVKGCARKGAPAGEHFFAPCRSIHDVDDRATPFALEVAVRYGFPVVAEIPFAKVERADKAVPCQELQRVVDGRSRKPRVFRQQGLVNGVDRGMDLVFPQVVKNYKPLSGRPYMVIL